MSHFKTMTVTKKRNVIIETVKNLCFDSSILVLCCDCFAFSPKPR